MMPIQVANVRTSDGEYSTIVRPDLMVETMFFPADGSDGKVIGLSSLAALAEQHRKSASE
jgi:hypothetical protein